MINSLLENQLAILAHDKHAYLTKHFQDIDLKMFHSYLWLLFKNYGLTILWTTLAVMMVGRFWRAISLRLAGGGVFYSWAKNKKLIKTHWFLFLFFAVFFNLLLLCFYPAWVENKQLLNLIPVEKIIIYVSYFKSMIP